MTNWTPRPYQHEASDMLEKFNGRALLADDMGLGKTVEVLLWCHRNPDVLPAVVVCPAGAKYHWQREAEDKFAFDVEVLTGQVPPEHPWRLGAPDFIIVNYDILGHSRDDGADKWLRHLVKLDPKLVVFDELHWLKEADALRTKRSRALCLEAPHLIGISGTPMLSKPIELWNFLSWCRPDVFDSHHEFVWRYCDPKSIGGGSFSYNGAANLDELHDKLLKKCMIRRLKRDVLGQLPPKQVVMVPLSLSDPRQYRLAEDDFRSWLNQYSTTRLRTTLRAQELKRLGYLRRLAAQLKMAAALSWLDDYLIDTDDKLLLGVVHHATTAKLLERYGRISVVVDGRTPMKQRLGLFDQFNNDPTTRLLIGNLQAAGAVYSAKTPAVAVLEFPWNPGELNQFLDRAHGVGRGVEGRTTTAYLLAAHDTIETKVLGILDRKQAVLSAAMDGGPTGEEFNMVTLIEAALRNGE